MTTPKNIGHERMEERGKICPPDAECPDCPPWPDIPRPMGVDPELVGTRTGRLVEELKRHSSKEKQTAFDGTKKIQFVFNGPPGNPPAEFVEVELEGKPINFGMWREMENGFWALEFDYPGELLE